MYVLERTQVVPRPRAEVFPFFADAANLERLTPPFLAFEILTPTPIEMRPGTLIDYRIKVTGIAMKAPRVRPGFAWLSMRHAPAMSTPCASSLDGGISISAAETRPKSESAE